MTNHALAAYDERINENMERLLGLLERILLKGSITRQKSTGDLFEEELSPRDLEICMKFLLEIMDLRAELRREAKEEAITISRDQLGLLYAVYEQLALQVPPARRERAKLEAIQGLREIFSEPGPPDQNRGLLQGS